MDTFVESESLPGFSVVFSVVLKFGSVASEVEESDSRR